jgi:outer membrane protein assembly factor BamB
MLALGAADPSRAAHPAALAGPVRVQDDAGVTAGSFHVYDTQVVRNAVLQVDEHLANGRDSEALAVLQELLEDHATAVLALEAQEAARGQVESVSYVGVGSWAMDVLRTLPEATLRLYRERHRAESEAALGEALEAAQAGGFGPLVSVAQRWPVTEAAGRAWLAMGDLLFERGEVDAARAAWMRALPALEPSLAQALPRALARVGSDAEGAGDAAEEVVLEGPPPAPRLSEGQLLAWLEDRAGEQPWNGLLARLRASVSLPPEPAISGRSALGGDDPAGRPFGQQPEGWPVELNLPRDPYWQSPASRRVFPVRAGQRLLLSTSRQLWCVAAETGELLWRQGTSAFGDDLPSWAEAERSIRGMETFREAIDIDEGFVAPASDGTVALAAFQLPLEVESQQDYNEHEIIKVLPERRLAAFDLELGTPLWHHAPPAGWDGDSGSFAERFTVVSPPVVHAGRVIVQCARTRGRIELHVAAFDLRTGDLAWSTPVITGQRQLNMFGRMEQEFVAPPVVCSEEGRAFVLTQLGVVACLDAFSGAPLWESSYEQVPLTAGRWRRAGTLASVWRNGPPILHEDAVLAAPFDSPHLLALDAATGEVRWSMRQTRLCLAADPTGRTREVNQLLGVREGLLVLGGERVAAFEAASDSLARQAPSRLAWAFPPVGADSLPSRWLPAPVLSGRSVLVPDERELVELDLVTGRRLALLPWPVSDGRRLDGNLLLDDGAFFIVDGSGARGYFEWDGLVQRARRRLEASPDDPEAAVHLATLLTRRARSLHARRQEAQDLVEAGRLLAEGRGLLDGLPAMEGRDAALHRLLRVRADVARAGLDAGQARLCLEEALALAPDPTAAGETRIALQEVLRDRDLDARLEVLRAIAANDLRERVAVAVVRPAPGEAARMLRLQPLEGPDPEGGFPLPSAVYASLEEVRLQLASRDEARRRAGLAALYALLPTWGRFPLPWRDGELEGQDVDSFARAVLAEGFTREGWERLPEVEAAAVAELEEALREGTDEALVGVSQRWPWTAAAERAESQRLEVARVGGDVNAAASIVLGSLPESWTTLPTSPETSRRWLLLAETLEAAGNGPLAAALLSHLTAVWPNAGSELASAAEARRATLAPRVVPAPEVPAQPSLARLETASLIEAGRFAAREDEPARLLTLTRDRVIGVGPGGRELWARKIPGGAVEAWFDPDRCVTAGGRLHLVLPDVLYSIDPVSGDLGTYATARTRGEYLHGDSAGGLLVTSRRELDAFVAEGIEPLTGARLWRVSLPYTFLPEFTLDAERGVVVLWPNGQGSARILDLFTGRERARIRLQGVRREEARAAFVHGDLLVLPALQRGSSTRTNRFRGFRLTNGEEAWSVDLSGLGRGYEATHVLRSGGKVWLVLATRAGGDSVRSLHEFDARRGMVVQASAATFPPRAILLGLGTTGRLDLAEPFLIAADPSRRTLLGISLEEGLRWSSPPGVELIHPRLSAGPPPIIGRERIALMADRPGGEAAALLVLDRATGETLSVRPASQPPTPMTGAPRPSVVPWDGGLWVALESHSEFLR